MNQPRPPDPRPLDPLADLLPRSRQPEPAGTSRPKHEVLVNGDIRRFDEDSERCECGSVCKPTRRGPIRSVLVSVASASFPLLRPG